MGEPTTTLAAPFILDAPYADRDAVRALVHGGGPYPLMWSASGYSMMSPAHVEPWFRAHWALDGRVAAPEHDADGAIASLLRHEPFVDAARRLFGAEVVRPSTLLLNLMGPMAAGRPHVDTPEFRGIERREVPIWLLVTMGASGLFDRWQLRVAGALTWFYDGDDGDYEYWPAGLGQPSRSARGPFGHVALIGDNNRMHHRVGAIGDAGAFARRATVDLGSVIARTAHGWEIRNRTSPDVALDERDIRISILWKAVVFADDREAQVFDRHEDDLDVPTVVAIFRRDLAGRGIDVAEPADPFTDAAWARALTDVYMAGY
jgi:hypothetical protein